MTRSAPGSARFGAHLRMAWWAPLLVMTVLPVSMVVLQIALYEVAALVEGDTPPGTITGLQLLAVNLSMGVTGLLAVPLVASFANVPWRSVLSFPRRVDLRRLALYLGTFLLFVAAANTIMAVVAPGATTWTTFGISGTTVALLAVIVLTTPLQSAAEELMFRGAIMPAAASWIRPVRPALITGTVLSSVVFAVVHGSADPWLLGYYAFFGVCAALMAVISGGLEASIALHVANNLLTSVLNAVLAGGGALVLDRSVGAGGPHLLILLPIFLAAVGAVWAHERRRATRHRAPEEATVDAAGPGFTVGSPPGSGGRRATRTGSRRRPR